jgi:hypothetical protein
MTTANFADFEEKKGMARKPKMRLQNRCTTTVLTRHDRGLAGALRGTWDTGQAPPMRVFSARSTSLS